MSPTAVVERDEPEVGDVRGLEGEVVGEILHHVDHIVEDVCGLCTSANDKGESRAVDVEADIGQRVATN